MKKAVLQHKLEAKSPEGHDSWVDCYLPACNAPLAKNPDFFTGSAWSRIIYVDAPEKDRSELVFAYEKLREAAERSDQVRDTGSILAYARACLAWDEQLTKENLV
jgi:hypothetical protein